MYNINLIFLCLRLIHREIKGQIDLSWKHKFLLHFQPVLPRLYRCSIHYFHQILNRRSQHEISTVKETTIGTKKGWIY